VAIVIALFFRRGLWGTLDDKFNLRLLPTQPAAKSSLDAPRSLTGQQ
jgi:hypothetical protein